MNPRSPRPTLGAHQGLNKGKKTTPAPEPYRPQSLPKCLQLKSRQPSTNPRVPQLPVNNTAGPPKAAAPPRAPAVYRPRPHVPSPVLQRKTTPQPKGVIQRSQSQNLASAIKNTPLLSFLNVDDVAKLSQVSKAINEAVERAPVRHRRAIDMPKGHAHEWPVYGRLEKDSVHPLYEPLESGRRKEYEESLAEYVDLAYQNMVNLVLRFGKGVDAPLEPDKLAEALSGSNQHWKKGNCVAVVVRKDERPMIALNALTKRGEPKESLDKSAHKALDEYQGQFIDMSELEYEHCEIRLWEQFGNTVDYIGIMQPCCLFCAAQLLAAGFTGFRGCHLQIYKRYTFSVKILSNPGRLRILFGGAVFNWYIGLNPKQKLDFLDLLAVGQGVKAKKSKVKKRKIKEKS